MAEEEDHKALKVPSADDGWKIGKRRTRVRPFGLHVTYVYTYHPQPWREPFVRIAAYKQWYPTLRARNDAEAALKKGHAPWRGQVSFKRIDR